METERDREPLLLEARPRPYELHDIGDLDLEEGGTIRGCKLAVAMHGTLNAAKDNAILVPTWYSGTSKIVE